MEPTSGLFATLALELAKIALKKTVDELPGRLRRLIEGDPEKMAALRTAFQVGLEAALKAMAPPDRGRAERYAGLLEHFLKLPETAEELAKLVDLRNVAADPEAVVDIPYLETLFRQAYPVDEAPEAYAGLNFPAAMRAFVQAYAHTIKLQPDKLPWINTAYLDAMLDRLGTLPGLAEDVRAILEAVTADRPDSEALLRSYLHRLVEDTRWLYLSGVDPKAAADTEKARLALAKVYTDLDTLSPEREERDTLEAMRRSDREMPRLSAIAAMDRYKRLVILGDPGSGKSTFVNFVALCLAGEWLGWDEANLPRLGDEWTHSWLLPVRVILRDFAARGLPDDPGERVSGDHLWQFLVSELGRTLAGCDSVLRKQLLEQGGLVLLDGLDEVPEAEQRREQVKDAIVGFARDFPRCRFLVTSRTYAYQRQDWRLSPGFHEVVLAPFNAEQIEVFIDRWYAHMAAVRADLSPDEAQGRAVLLKHAIKTTPGLQDLAPRPLLLTLMASLHAWRGGSLPEKREELYADCVDLLLDVWEQPKIVRDARGNPLIVQPSVREWLKAPKARVRAMLDALAYEAHAGQPTLEGTADIAEVRLVAALLGVSENPDLKPARVVEYVRDRAGLLTPRGAGVYAFPHRTFQEYLAACHLTDREFPNELAQRVRQEPERWREVVLLAAAKAARGAPYAAWALIEALCPDGPPEGRPEVNVARAALIAAQSLVEVGLYETAGPQYRPKVEHLRGWLVRCIETEALLSPMERAAAGAALAHLGDPRPGVGLDPQTGLPDIVWCEVPTGPFLMGSDKAGDPQAYDDELPQHEVTLSAYSIGKYPVTNAQYAAFVAAEGYQERRYWTEAGWQWKGERIGPETYGGVFDLPNHPVVMVTWYEAVAFCRWLTERLQISDFRFAIDDPSAGSGQALADGNLKSAIENRKFVVRLPSEAEWEKASRGTDGRIYPWGDKPDPNKANYDETGVGATSAVGCFSGGTSSCGALDMSGNVWEWCQTKWRDSYEKPADESLEGTVPRVVRGGSWVDYLRRVRCASRAGPPPDPRPYHLGFRVVVSPGSP